MLAPASPIARALRTHSAGPQKGHIRAAGARLARRALAKASGPRRSLGGARRRGGLFGAPFSPLSSPSFAGAPPDAGAEGVFKVFQQRPSPPDRHTSHPH